ncbi:sigma-54-dependent Fis family transcriptional regulator [Opitutaceae bacterium EW11]|nr:sigma-54-dependent Fis family transcriptional regulator [Opitutaceae bacterium EW11]
MRFLLIGDEQKCRRLLSLGLGDPEFGLCTAVNSLEELNGQPLDRDFSVALIDWEMRTNSAAEAMALLRRKAPLLPVVAMAANPDAATAARARGAVHCLLKPVDVDELRSALERHAIPVAAPAPAEIAEASDPAAAPAPVETAPAKRSAPKDDAAAQGVEFGTRSPVMQRMLEIAWRVAPTPASVLILGENGTGKNVLASAIHRRSERRQAPFVTVHCPCLQEQLLESELFGHVKGSFTGAVSDTHGKVAAAEGGTLFLDEIGDLPLSIQPKLLRLLQERKYERVGETTSRTADIRVIAATNRDLQMEVKAGRFREDLFYRLNVVSVEVLPLRERVEDIVPMAEHFLANMSRSLGRSLRGFSQLACETLRNYRWPGNVRELRNAVERAAILTDRETLDVADFSQLAASAPQAPGPRVGEFVSVNSLVEEHIRQVVARAASLEHAARILRIDRSTLYRKRKRWQTATPFAEFAPAAHSQVG